MRTLRTFLAAGLLLGGALVSPALAQVGGGIRSSGAPVSTGAPLRVFDSSAVALFVDGTNGSDSNTCTSSGTGACKTIQAALDKVPAFYSGSSGITIDVAAGTYAESPKVAGVVLRNRSPGTAVTIRGTRTAVNDNGGAGFAVSAVTNTDPDTGVDNGTRRITVSPDPGWTVDAYKGMWVEGMSGTSSGNVLMIVSNGSNYIDYAPGARLLSYWSTSSVVKIVNQGVIVNGSWSPLGANAPVTLQDMEINGGASSPFGSSLQYGQGFTCFRCRLTGAQAQLNYAGIVSLSGSHIKTGMRFIQHANQANVAGSLVDWRAGSQSAQCDQVPRIGYDATVIEGPGSLSFESCVVTMMPKLVNRAGIAPTVSFNGRSGTSGTGGVAVALVSISSASVGQTAFAVGAGSNLLVNGGIYVTNAGNALVVNDTAAVSVWGAVVLSGMTSFYTGAGASRASFALSSITGNVTYGIVLGGSATLTYTGTAPTPTATNALSLDGGSTYFPYTVGPVIGPTGAAFVTPGLSGTLILGSSASRPTCDSTTRGAIWIARGSAGVADVLSFCMKDAANAYAWVTK